MNNLIVTNISVLSISLLLLHCYVHVVVVDPSQLFRELDRVGDGEVTAEDFESVDRKSVV